jgi:hypothetical protein
MRDSGMGEMLLAPYRAGPIPAVYTVLAPHKTWTKRIMGLGAQFADADPYL